MYQLQMQTGEGRSLHRQPFWLSAPYAYHSSPTQHSRGLDRISSQYTSLIVGTLIEHPASFAFALDQLVTRQFGAMRARLPVEQISLLTHFL